MNCQIKFGCVLLALLLAAPLAAQDFAVLANPPRVVATAQPGSVHRDIIEFTNASATASTYQLRTADWTLNEEAQAVFSDDLLPNSCRPWVVIERRNIRVAPGAMYQFRFEVRVPENTPPMECRFAIMIEGEPQMVGKGVQIPVTGQIGIIVYLAIGDAKSNLSVVSGKKVSVDGQLLPALVISNSGKAHGRLEGFVDATDAKGKKFTLTASTTPVLAGETRTVALVKSEASEVAQAIAFPVVLRGRVDAGEQRLDVSDLKID